MNIMEKKLYSPRATGRSSMASARSMRAMTTADPSITAIILQSFLIDRLYVRSVKKWLNYQ